MPKQSKLVELEWDITYELCSLDSPFYNVNFKTFKIASNLFENGTCPSFHQTRVYTVSNSAFLNKKADYNWKLEYMFRSNVVGYTTLLLWEKWAHNSHSSVHKHTYKPTFVLSIVPIYSRMFLNFLLILNTALASVLISRKNSLESFTKLLSTDLICTTWYNVQRFFTFQTLSRSIHINHNTSLFRLKLFIQYHVNCNRTDLKICFYSHKDLLEFCHESKHLFSLQWMYI